MAKRRIDSDTIAKRRIDSGLNAERKRLPFCLDLATHLSNPKGLWHHLEYAPDSFHGSVAARGPQLHSANLVRCCNTDCTVMRLAPAVESVNRSTRSIGTRSIDSCLPAAIGAV
jgi:hypothetical protein